MVVVMVECPSSSFTVGYPLAVWLALLRSCVIDARWSVAFQVAEVL
jgi:hypothetical protein